MTPTEFSLLQNYPNPFNPSTTIPFSLAVSGRTVLKVYDLLGREVATVLDRVLEGGVLHRVSFDGSGLSSGVYLYRLQAGIDFRTKTFVILK